MLEPSHPSRLLFLCTGNYYRSRFAEMLFNALASASGLLWVADSRGLALERGINNVGPISVHVIERLQDGGILVDAPMRFPLQVHDHDLQQADLIVALDEAEHRVLLQQRYPHWVDRVLYWQINDLHLMPADVALSAIEQEVCRLIIQLSAAM